MAELLAPHTTLRLGGPARDFVTVADEETLVTAVASADRDGVPLLVLGGGSNLVVGDAGFDGRVVAVRTHGVQAEPAGEHVVVRVAAGEEWDSVVARAVAEGWSGLEALAGIPGRTGATPIQNVGAYGQEVSQTITSVRVWDRRQGAVRELAADECGFGYRTSRFKREPGSSVVLEVTFRLPRGALSAPVRYAELARRLGCEPGDRRPAAEVREAVLALRRGKGMVLDSADHDTWSAGSFFTNPIVEAEQVPEGAPAFPQPDGRVKTSAAWLIDHAGFDKGYGTGRARLSTKHVLALTNRGGATTSELLALAEEVREGVRRRYGIELVNEPVLVGVELG